MLNIYLFKEGMSESDKKRIVSANDAWFNVHWEEYNLARKDCNNIMDTIDKARYIGDGKVESRFAGDIAINIVNMSTGCKTALNIINNDDKIFSVTECGDNVIDEILQLDKGNVLVPCCMAFPIGICDKAKLYYDGKCEILNDPCIKIMEIMDERYNK